MKKKDILKRLMIMYADMPQSELGTALSNLVNDLGGYHQMELDSS